MLKCALFMKDPVLEFFSWMMKLLLFFPLTFATVIYCVMTTIEGNFLVKNTNTVLILFNDAPFENYPCILGGRLDQPRDSQQKKTELQNLLRKWGGNINTVASQKVGKTCKSSRSLCTETFAHQILAHSPKLFCRSDWLWFTRTSALHFSWFEFLALS